MVCNACVLHQSSPVVVVSVILSTVTHECYTRLSGGSRGEKRANMDVLSCVGGRVLLGGWHWEAESSPAAEHWSAVRQRPIRSIDSSCCMCVYVCVCVCVCVCVMRETTDPDYNSQLIWFTNDSCETSSGLLWQSAFIQVQRWGIRHSSELEEALVCLKLVKKERSGLKGTVHPPKWKVSHYEATASYPVSLA